MTETPRQQIARLEREVLILRRRLEVYEEEVRAENALTNLCIGIARHGLKADSLRRLEELVSVLEYRRPSPATRPLNLTSREIVVIEEFLRGTTISQMPDEIGVTSNSAHQHLRVAKARNGISSTNELTNRYLLESLNEPD